MLTVDFCVSAQPWNGREAEGLWVCGVMKFTHVPTESGRVGKLAGERSKLNKEETSHPAVCLLKAFLVSGQKLLLPIKMTGATLPSKDTGFKFPCSGYLVLATITIQRGLWYLVVCSLSLSPTMWFQHRTDELGDLTTALHLTGWLWGLWRVGGGDQ